MDSTVVLAAAVSVLVLILISILTETKQEKELRDKGKERESLVDRYEGFWDKGSEGEALVNHYAKSMLDKNKYHLIENITLPTRYGTTQIDHIIVSVYGVFVIETKNMTGWIFGGAYQRTWMQVIYGDSYEFQNPLHQNYKHVRALQSLLRVNRGKIHSVVVFVGDSDFKTRIPNNVRYDTDYIDFIKSRKKKVLTESQVKKIIEKIRAARLPPNRKTDYKHARYVQNVIEEKENHYVPDCPKCGGFMVLKIARRGVNRGQPFWGCKRYPYCRGLRNIT